MKNLILVLTMAFVANPGFSMDENPEDMGGGKLFYLYI